MSGMRNPGLRGISVASRLALVGTVLALIAIAYYPFAWDPVRTVHNQVARGADGSLRFGEMNYARTPGPPAWIPAVGTSGTIGIDLEAEPTSAELNAPIMMLASDYWHTDFAVGQDHSDLVVWLRRPGSNANGDPAFVIPGVFQPRRWASVSVIAQRGDVRVVAAGRTRLTAHLPADFARVWGQGRIALGDEVHGGGPWQGQIRRAQVSAGGRTVDYLRPGKLVIPPTYLYLPDHIEPFPPMDARQLRNAVLDMISFIPLGFLIVLAGRLPMSTIRATLLAGGTAVALGAGKFLFYGRHTAVINIGVQIAGGSVGAFLAAWLARSRRRRRPVA